MSRERFFRFADEASFDWRGPAGVLRVADDVAQVLYVRAMQRVLDVQLAEALYLRWLRDVTAERSPAEPLSLLGHETRMLEDTGESRRPIKLEGLSPGRTTRVLLEANSEDVPRFDEVQLAMRAFVSKNREVNATPTSTSPSAWARDWLTGHPLRRNVTKPSVPGRRTLISQAADPRFDFQDYRVLGLLDLLRRLGPDHLLRQEVIAAAANTDRSIAGRATYWHEPLPNTMAPSATTPNGIALWRAAERHAVTLYRRAVSSSVVDQHDPAVESALQQRGIGQLLPAELYQEIERALGVPLAGVRIHTDAMAAQAARALGSEAFTVGEDIFFAEGAFAPDTPSGRRLLAHELTHVAQSRRGGAAPGGTGPRVSQPGEQHEQEADAVAERVVPVAASPTPVAPVTQSLAGTVPAILRATADGGTGSEPEGHGDAAMLQALRYSPGRPLPSDVLRLMERLLDHSFADVLIHVDNSASEQAASIAARAFTIGNRIFFREDAYRPDTDRGCELLAHELVHVIQWRQGRVPEVTGPPRISSPGDYLEQEAATIGRQAAEQARRGDDGTVEVPAFQTTPSSAGTSGRVAASPVRSATSPTILRDGPTDPHAVTVPTGGTPVGRVGIVGWDGQPALRLRSSASTSADNAIGSLAFNTTLQVIKEFPGGWYFVSTQDGRLGYVAKVYVKINLPEPNAKLHRVDSGLPGFAISIAERYYRQYARDWGQDLRFYVNVLTWVNNRRVPNTASGWRDVHFNADELIWIPSHDFAQTLRGVVNSGSISHDLADSIGIADFLDRAEELYRDIDTAIRLSAQYLPEAIGRHVEAALLGVLESLAWMMAIAAGVLAVFTAIGAGLGLLAGGVSAAPGAAAGFEVGMVLLNWLGLGMLVVWIRQSLMRVGAAFGDFLAMVWNARGNQAQLDRAARQFAEAVGTLCGVLLQGLVMWAVSIGATRAINALRGTRFGSRFNNTETGQWLNERVRSVQSGEAPLPTPRAVLEGLIRGVELVDARNSPLGEFDGIDMAGRRFVENKSATGIDRPNPRTGRPHQTAVQWAERQITTKTTNRIHALANAAATRGPGGGSTPSLAEIRGFRHIHFMIDGTSPALRAAVFAELASLRTAHPGWTFTAEFGVRITISPVPGTGTRDE